MAITTKDIEARIKKLKLERDNFLNHANNQISALNGAIEALQNLLKDQTKELPAKEEEGEQHGNLS